MIVNDHVNDGSLNDSPKNNWIDRPVQRAAGIERPTIFVVDNQDFLNGTCEYQPASTKLKLINDTSEQRRANDNDVRSSPTFGSRERAIMKLTSVDRPFSLGLLKLTSILHLHGVHAIRILQLDGPRTVQEGQNLKLRCLYDSKGDKLSSLSWYKDGREFFRYQPFERRQPVLAFNLSGINVDVGSMHQSCA